MNPDKIRSYQFWRALTVRANTGRSFQKHGCRSRRFATEQKTVVMSMAFSQTAREEQPKLTGPTWGCGRESNTLSPDLTLLHR